MIRALGMSQTEFSPFKPGRLCRGRERWIEPWEAENDEEKAQLVCRLVISGAAFTDDSAADAKRGIPHSGLEVAGLIAALFPRKKFLTFMEDGHPADIPDGAEGIELYEGYRAGGRAELPLVRWHKVISGVRELRSSIGDESEDRVRGFAVLGADSDIEQLSEQVFQLVGMGCLDSPPARYQPVALLGLLEHCKALVLLHRDKHGPVVAVYSREPMEAKAKLVKACGKAGALFVPFAIPPMLARWDRALSELREVWDEAEPFPVPAAPEESRWDDRRRRRRRKKEEVAADDSASDSSEGSEELSATDTASESNATTTDDAIDNEVMEPSEAPTVDFDDLDALLEQDES